MKDVISILRSWRLDRLEAVYLYLPLTADVCSLYEKRASTFAGRGAPIHPRPEDEGRKKFLF
jgi:hypothetical protein